MNFYGIEKLTLVDYLNKVACILFTKGCNFSCPWCHNSGLVMNDPNLKEIPFEEVLKYLKKRVGILDGVVISGGEPTLMKDLKEKIIAIRELGYSIKLDTNGSNPKILKELVNEKLVDYVAMDIKNSFSNYPKTIGLTVAPIDRIKESIEFLKENHVDYEFRTTLVNEFFNEESIEDMGTILNGAIRLFLQQFINGENCIDSKSLTSVSLDKANIYKDILKKYVNDVSLRGYEN